MNGKQRGFTLIEILVVVTIIGVLAGLVVVLIPRGQFEANKIDCINNVKNIVGLIESTNQQKYPTHSGANLVLYLVNKGDLASNKDSLKLLFCPSDTNESLEQAGGVDAYKDISLDRREYDRLTSYAGRDQQNGDCAAKKGGTEPVVLLCDDSEDHHDKKGFVVGLTGGSAKFRHKVDDYSLRHDAPVEIGEASAVPELTCLRKD
jgi:prepilin-type N-terminal cleavage/methylation domain-containing protein